MKKTIRNLILAGCFLFTISYDSCTLGVSYDTKYKLYPEVSEFSCIMSKNYGQRWERLGFITFGLGTSLVIAAFIAYRRTQESKNINILDLVDE